jgi:hypothetical protein
MGAAKRVAFQEDRGTASQSHGAQTKVWSTFSRATKPRMELKIFMSPTRPVLELGMGTIATSSITNQISSFRWKIVSPLEQV